MVFRLIKYKEEEFMKAKVRRISIPKDKRAIVISDIHGNLKLFKKLLKKVNYGEKDILIILGDIIEKGDMSLKTLQYIMELSIKSDVHVITGNCDALWRYIKYEIDDDYILNYILYGEHSIFKEMCDELGIDLDEKPEIKFIKDKLIKNFSNEFHWLEDLPHIIESEDFIFAHAGITSENLEEQDADKVIKNNAFMEQGLVFSKYVVVGHWPITNYKNSKGCCNPIINKEQHIISIDGGNEIKDEGQLNALIIYNKENIAFDFVNNFSIGEIIEDQVESSNSIKISWMDNEVKVLEERDEFSLCRHVSSNHELLIKNNRLFKVNDGTYCYDYTDHFLQLSRGEKVFIIEKSKNQTLIKKHDKIGWVLNKNIKELGETN